jgi:soluble lytic murein transglycosylase-like protein
MTIKELSILLNVPVSWLQTVFDIESKNNPQAINYSTGAVGLIQFMPATAQELGTTTNDLLNMDYNTQLKFVYRYLSRYAKKINTITDLYLAVFYPYAIGKPLNFILGSEISGNRALTVRKYNPGFTTALTIKKSDIARYVKNKYKKLGFSELNYLFDRANKILGI